MTNHPNQKRAKWTTVSYGCRENPGQFDTGNGAIATVEESTAYPGIERVRISSYCGRTSDDRTYFRRATDAAGAFVKRGAPSFETAAEAMKEKDY